MHTVGSWNIRTFMHRELRVILIENLLVHFSPSHQINGTEGHTDWEPLGSLLTFTSNQRNWGSYWLRTYWFTSHLHIKSTELRVILTENLLVHFSPSHQINGNEGHIDWEPIGSLLTFTSNQRNWGSYWLRTSWFTSHLHIKSMELRVTLTENLLVHFSPSHQINGIDGHTDWEPLGSLLTFTSNQQNWGSYRLRTSWLTSPLYIKSTELRVILTENLLVHFSPSHQINGT